MALRADTAGATAAIGVIPIASEPVDPGGPDTEPLVRYATRGETLTEGDDQTGVGVAWGADEEILAGGAGDLAGVTVRIVWTPTGADEDGAGGPEPSETVGEDPSVIGRYTVPQALGRRSYSAARRTSGVTLRHYPRLELPPAFGDSTSWRRVDREPVRLERLGRIGWRVRVGEGAPHRVVCATRSGAVVADCDCAGWRYDRWCAHVAAVFRAYVRRELDLADLDRGPAEEADALWRGRARVDG